jgi:RNA polymerase sigma-70 factor (ECF subfamily)
MTNETAFLVEKSIEQKQNHYPVNRAFAELVKRFQDLVFGYVYAMVKDSFISHDITQDVFITAYDKLDSLKNYHAFPGWIRQIAKRECLRIMRKNRREVHLPPEIMENYESGYATPQAIYEKKEARAEVLAAIDDLPDTQRIPTVMYYIDGYSQQDIADFLNMKTDTIKKRLQRARENMRRTIMQSIKDNLEPLRPSKNNKILEKINLYTTFDSVAKIGQMDLLEHLIMDGVNVNEKDAAGRTMLHWAVENNHAEAVRLLLKSGAKTDIKDRSGRTAAQLAAQKNNKMILSILNNR